LLQRYLSLMESEHREAIESAVQKVGGSAGADLAFREDLLKLAGKIHRAEVAYLEQVLGQEGTMVSVGATAAAAARSVLGDCRWLIPTLMGYGYCLPDALKLGESLRDYVLERLGDLRLEAEEATGWEELQEQIVDADDAVSRTLCSTWSVYCAGRFCSNSCHQLSASLNPRSPEDNHSGEISGGWRPRLLKDAERLESLSEVAGGLAHEYNNLLTVILGGVDLALRELPPGSEARALVESARKSTLEAADLTAQVLAFSGGSAEEPQVVDLSHVTKGMDRLLRDVLTEDTSLTYDFASIVPPVEIGVEQFRQAVLHLVRNGVEAMEDGGGTVEISTGSHPVDRDYLEGTLLNESLPDGRYAFLQVSDSGRGVDPVTWERMFDPFFTTKPARRGLGLAAALGVVRGHGGTLKVYTEEGRGTSVKVLFPEAKSGLKSQGVTKQSGPVKLAHGTILLVDDEKQIVDICGRMLEREGLRVLTAEDGQEGVDMFRQHGEEIELVILDMAMPRMDGAAAFREMRRIREDVPVILMSGYSRQGALASFQGKGLAGFLQKPFLQEDLLAEVGKVLGAEE